MLGLCLGLAGQLWATVPQPTFTLGWWHTVEKIRWEEDYQLTPEGLLLTEARVKGTGAGMEIPAGAVFRDDSWHYHEKRPAIPLLKLGRAPEGGDYDICFNGQCLPMSHWIGKPNHQTESVELWPCDTSTKANPDK